MFEKYKKNLKQHNCNHHFELPLLPKLVQTYPHKTIYRCSKCGCKEVRIMSDEDVKEYERSQWVNGLSSLSEADKWE